MADEQNEGAHVAVKNAQGKRVSSGQRLMVFNIYNKYLLTDGESKSRSVILAARDSGISESKVWRIVKEMEEDGTISSPSKKRTCATFFDCLDEDQKKTIRCTVHNFFQRNEVPTLDKVLQAITENETLPLLSRSTVWKILKQLGFPFEKRGRNHMLLENAQIVLWRRRYVNKIREHRQEGRKIYYTDETWVNIRHTVLFLDEEDTIR